jgi:hypothetical protein
MTENCSASRLLNSPPKVCVPCFCEVRLGIDRWLDDQKSVCQNTFPLGVVCWLQGARSMALSTGFRGCALYASRVWLPVW